jgi:preprotein translocase subunit SecG
MSHDNGIPDFHGSERGTANSEKKYVREKEEIMKRIITVIALILIVLLILLSVSAARKHRWYGNQSNAIGWEIMSPEEQREYNSRMQNLSNLDECSSYLLEHSKKMEERAREKGVVLPVINLNPCEVIKRRQMYK